MEQRGLLSTVHSTRRAPAVQVKPGNDVRKRYRQSTLQSTKPFITPAGCAADVRPPAVQVIYEEK